MTATNNPPSKNDRYITPDPDPGESFDDMTSQIFGYAGSSAPNMSGFAQNYYDVGGDPGDIMFYFMPDQVPITSALATEYAVWDQWFASGPVQSTSVPARRV